MNADNRELLGELKGIYQVSSPGKGMELFAY